ncbi:MAG: TonB-dependent receptor [Bacteroidia bacterium]
MKLFAGSLLLLFCLLPFNGNAQKYTLSGYIKDSTSGEALIGSTVYLPRQETGAAANAYGYYSITLPADTLDMVVSYVGYESLAKRIILDRNRTLNISLIPQATMLKAAVVTDKKSRENVEAPKMSTIEVSVETVKEMPTIGGEKDVLKTLQLLPGVQSGNEGSAGFYVRGGGPDQNMIMLDEAVVYNPFHLFGFFSIFNPDALRNITLIKGGFPARYGGRLSSILDMSMKEGNLKEYHAEGGIGLIASRITAEGPIVKDKSSFMVSGRRTYADAVVRPFLPKGEDGAYYFYDVNGKVNYKFSDKDRIYLSGYHGKDIFFTKLTDDDFKLRYQVDWGNNTGTLRWNHIFTQKLFSNTSLIYNDYGFRVNSEFDSINVGLFSGIRDITLKSDFDYFPNTRNKLTFGFNFSLHRFIPQAIKGSKEEIEEELGILFPPDQVKNVNESAVYVNDEIIISDDLAISLGVRIPWFNYKSTNYWSVEPRVTGKYSLSANSSLKASYTVMNQYLHLVSSSSISIPLDLWVPSSDIVKPQIAQQAAVGYFQNFFDNKYEASVELYYKDMRNQIEYRPGANVFFNDNIDEEFIFGKGWSYGGEFFFRRREGRLNGWVGYTLAWSERKFPDVNRGLTFPAKYDRRHDLSVVAFYNFSKKWSFSAVFVYGSGHWVTFPKGSYTLPVNGWQDNNSWWMNAYPGGSFNHYEGRNNQRLRAYNRLDVGLKYTVPDSKWDSEWRLDIYNLYSRRNAYFIYPVKEKNPNNNLTRTYARQVSLFPMIPSISYNFKF